MRATVIGGGVSGAATALALRQAGVELVDLVRYLLGIAILFAIGALLGFRVHGTVGTSLAAPTDTLPGWLRTWAEINPVTHAMDA